MIKNLTIKPINQKLSSAIKKNEHRQDSYYLIDLIKLKEEVDYFISSFNNKRDIYSYSYKTNYSKPLVKYLDKRGFLSELVSPFEIDISKEFNIPPSRIIYNGPLKNEESIEYVLSGNGIVNIDNIEDLISIYKILESRKDLFNVRVGLRISFEEENLNSRFGISYGSKDYFYIIDKLISNKRILFECLHMHYPQRDLESFINRVEKIMKVANSIKYINKDLKSIDIGGGLPSRMPKCVLNSIGIDKAFSIKIFSKKLNLLRKQYNLDDINIILEPGTAIAANVMSIVGNVTAINVKGNLIYLNTDLSRSLLGNLRNTVSYPISIIKNKVETHKKNKKTYIIAGFSCVESDLLGKIENDSEIEVGDRLVFASIGSYSSVFKSPFIRGDIPIYSWDGDYLKFCRRSQTAKDVCDLYIS